MQNEVRRIGFICLALALVTLTVFWSVHRNGFINYDDDQYIVENVHVLNGLSWADFKWAFTTAHTGYPHPLTWLTHQLDCQMFGNWAGGHHLTSVLIHAVNSILLFLLFWRMTGSVWKSAFVAGVFAVHPLHVESVAWASERKDVLCGLFWIVTLHAYVSYVKNPTKSRYARILLLFACGLLSKPTIVTLPIILLLLDYWPLHRAGLDKDNHRKWLSLFVEKIPMLVLAGIFTAITILAQHFHGAMRSFTALPWHARIVNATISYAKYIRDTIWPAKLAVFYPHVTPLAWQIVVAFGGLAIITIIALKVARRYPFVAVGWFWYLIALVPVIGLLQVGDQARADRYMYIPIIGLSLMITWFVPAVISSWGNRRIVLTTVGIVMLGGYTILAQRQVTFWRDSVQLFQRALFVTPNNAPLVFDAYADALMRVGRLGEADDLITKTRNTFPENAKRLNLAGSIKFQLDANAEAETLWKRALELAPDEYEAHNNLGILYAKQEQWEQARYHFERLIQLRPNDVVALGNLAQLCFLTKDYANALRHCDQGLAVSPNDPTLRMLKTKTEQAAANER